MIASQESRESANYPVPSNDQGYGRPRDGASRRYSPTNLLNRTILVVIVPIEHL